MRDGSASTLPERVLMQLLADAFRLQCILTLVKRLKQRQGSAYERLAGEDASPSDGAIVGKHGDDGMNTILRLQFVGPAAFGSAPLQPEGAYFTNLHTC